MPHNHSPIPRGLSWQAGAVCALGTTSDAEMTPSPKTILDRIFRFGQLAVGSEIGSLQTKLVVVFFFF